MPQAQTLTQSGLQTLTINIQNTDVYNIIATITTSNQVSTATQGSGGGAGTGTGGAPVPSQVVCTVKQNGSTIYTSQPGDKGVAINGLVCTAADIITMALSSSLSNDQQPQAIKMTVAVSQGPL